MRTSLRESGIDASIAVAGASPTGGVGGQGAVGSGGTLGEGGMAGQGGTTAGGGVLGMPCTGDQDCPSDATCCDGSGTRAEGSGDGNLTCTWAEAKAYCAGLALAGVSGWRLPGAKELLTLVDFTRSGYNTQVSDPTAFPDTPRETFWSSSPHAGTSGDAWDIRFGDGSLVDDLASFAYRVRCARGSRCYPKSRFQVLPGGLVSDQLTELVWQQRANPTAMRLSDAETSCANAGFRLPTMKELESLVDLTMSHPSIDQQAFPNTPGDWFWASSLQGSSSFYAWIVLFADGGSSVTDVMSFYKLRCVR